MVVLECSYILLLLSDDAQQLGEQGGKVGIGGKGGRGGKRRGESERTWKAFSTKQTLTYHELKRRVSVVMRC